jgi:hypothetical protein
LTHWLIDQQHIALTSSETDYEKGCNVKGLDQTEPIVPHRITLCIDGWEGLGGNLVKHG